MKKFKVSTRLLFFSSTFIVVIPILILKFLNVDIKYSTIWLESTPS